MASSAEIKNIIRCGQLGDLIEFKYPIGFSHWGVYEGDGQVVHFAVADENELQRMFRIHILQKVFPSCGSILLGQTKIQREHITSVPVPEGAKIKISNNCHHYPASSVTDMRRRLHGLLGEVLDYNLLSQNCEHFATFVRYGVAVCNQVPFHQDKVQRETTHMFQDIIAKKSVSMKF
ncbi:phospholipase A and acyltransferase 2-like [Clarias gariepinus]|uniref:phospholipase A and acyltransferase 2-like n=1 Tax=Clarias gariepinus TaxID=13013 RepID=UPI00234D7941|nr:phospholipase A and acyltransferase 2-like [Clarias gariepinus]